MNAETEVSGSIEMYLATIAVLQADEQPVPLSQLADQMSHSPVSVNEMCRKLVERGWAAYQPYKGVTLTSQGATLAQQVLCRRRLWEVFLVDRLGADPQEAESFACQLEHATPDNLARRLAAYLAYPVRSPQDEPIPCPYRGRPHLPVLPLSALVPGQRGLVTRVVADEIAKDFLHGQGVSTGTEVEVLASSSDGSLLLQTSERCLCLSKALATQVEAQPLTEAESPSQIEVKQ